MKKLINDYLESCAMVRERIGELRELLKQLRESGREDIAEEMNLEQRISLLYTEHREAMETAEYLTSYMRRIEERAEKRNVL